MKILSLNRLPAPGVWWLRLATALLWAMAVASLVYWLSRLAGTRAVATVPAVVAQRQAPSDGPSHQAALARMLGAQPSAATVESSLGAEQRFALLGVIASTAGHGAALIAVDGEPARAWRVGAQVASGYVLATLGRREAVLQNSARPHAKIVLRLPSPDTEGEANPQPPDELAEFAPIRSVPEITQPAAPAPASEIPSPTSPARLPGAASPPATPPETPVAHDGPPPRLDSRYPAAAGARR